jgi:hypothetical protein
MTMQRDTDTWLEVLSLDECLDLLARNDFGRLAVVIDEFPIIVPVNDKLVDRGARYEITGRRLHPERRPWAFRADAYL